MRIIERLTKAIRRAAVHNPDVQVAPAAILWPDGDRQWEPVAARLQAELPEMFVLGEFHPERRTGPAIWLRCVIAGKAPNVSVPNGATPILYLPGVSRQDLRAVESCQEHIKPLAELQYRGVLWSQINAKDWTILAFLKSDQGGLGLDVSQDNDTKRAMQLALFRLLDEEIDLLQGKRLEKDYFNTLLTGGDPVRDLLQWLDQGEAFKSGRDEIAWVGFVEVCKSQLAFDPENDGPIKGAELLAGHKGPWLPVWDRYCEAPKRYPSIPDLIRKTHTPGDLFADRTGWPQWNDDEEASLRGGLLKLANSPAHEARDQLAELDKKHSSRRDLVWSELGHSPLACAMAHLGVVAEVTGHSLAAGSAADLAAAYQTSGWRADDALVRALAAISKEEDKAAVEAALRATYLPWAEEAARHLQKVVGENGYPGGKAADRKPVAKTVGECILFVDGLRLDLARRLVELLEPSNSAVSEKMVWSALPSVTATAKPGVSPVVQHIVGQDANSDFEPCVAQTGQSLKGGYHFRKLLEAEGWQVLDRTETGDPKGSAWCESGDIDKEGHNRGWKLATHTESMVGEIRDRVRQLLGAGWKSVRVVTDHGWLLLPGGLPKTKLPSSLSENTWGRCAAIKPGASTDENLYPWFWNPHLDFGLADGVSCYISGREYTHGGLSLQECLTLELIVTPVVGARGLFPITITDVSWKGLRCKVAIEGEPEGLSLDVRTHPGNLTTSVVMSVKPFKEDGTSSVVVEDEDLEGHETVIVIVDGDENLIAQQSTVVGEDAK